MDAPVFQSDINYCLGLASDAYDWLLKMCPFGNPTKYYRNWAKTPRKLALLSIMVISQLAAANHQTWIMFWWPQLRFCKQSPPKILEGCFRPRRDRRNKSDITSAAAARAKPERLIRKSEFHLQKRKSWLSFHLCRKNGLLCSSKVKSHLTQQKNETRVRSDRVTQKSIRAERVSSLSARHPQLDTPQK